jgi:uncharacterized phage-like protein YoqJ
LAGAADLRITFEAHAAAPDEDPFVGRLILPADVEVFTRDVLDHYVLFGDEVWSGTGHRPPKLGGYGDNVFERLVALAMWCLQHGKPNWVVSGMALGWDLALAIAALLLGIKLIAAVPCFGQDGTWPDASRALYAQTLVKAEYIVIVSDGFYEPRKMQVRNEWMNRRATVVLALHDGSAGGTGNCVRDVHKLSERTGKPRLINVWNEWRDTYAPRG